MIGDRFLFFLVESFDFVVDFFQVWWLGHGAKSDSGTRLIDHVNRLVWQAPTGDVPIGHFDGGQESVICNLDAVVVFVPLAEPFENFNGFIIRGRIDNDLLKSSRESIVLFDVLSILVQRGGTNALDLTACQSGLKDVGRIDGAFRTPCPNQRV